MPAGRYRDRINILPDASLDGSPTPDYTTYAPQFENLPCDITTVAGLETFRGRQIEATTSHVVELHYVTGISPRSRASVVGGTLSGRTLSIKAVIPTDTQPRKLTLNCEEVTT